MLCKICNQSFNNAQSVFVHLKVLHRGQKEYACIKKKTCRKGRSFSSVNNITQSDLMNITKLGY